MTRVSFMFRHTYTSFLILLALVMAGRVMVLDSARVVVEKMAYILYTVYVSLDFGHTPVFPRQIIYLSVGTL